MDVVSAFRLSQATIAHLFKIEENDFDAIYKTSIEISEKIILIFKIINSEEPVLMHFNALEQVLLD